MEREYQAMMGKYLCVIDHVAGIQYEEADKDKVRRPLVGAIRIPTDRFFMEIARDDSISCGLFRWPGSDCKTKYKMTVKSDLIFLREHGYSALLPYTFHTSGGLLTIIATGRFSASYRFGWDTYVFNGRCEKIN